MQPHLQLRYFLFPIIKCIDYSSLPKLFDVRIIDSRIFRESKPDIMKAVETARFELSVGFRPVQLNAGRPNINSVRPNINTGRTNINSVRPRVNTVNSNVNTVRFRQPIPTRTSNKLSPKRPHVNQFNQRRHFSKSYSPVRRPIDRNAAKMSYFNADHPLKNMVDRGIFDSGCSGHMTCNKDQLEDFKEFNWGSVTFGGNKGYITGKGRIRVGNLDFDSVSLVKELGHFNLFSISQICDKQHKVLFTETECLVVSSDFKMPDENQILLKVPRHHNMYSFDMKTPTPAKSFAYTLSVLGKFDGKSDEGFLVGYSLNSKAYRVYNLVTKRVEVNLHVNFLEDKPNVKGVGYRWMFDIEYLTDSMNFISVSLENQANPHEGTSEVTNSAGTSQSPNANASEEKDKDAELIVMPSAVKNTEEKVETRKSSTNSKKEKILIEPQQEKEASSTEDNPKILVFRGELEEIAQKHLGTVPENNSTNTLSVNSGSERVNTGRLDPDDSPMPELEIFHKSEI
ncbi:ribonuclease H-like domain-containing protein [Tanacetum coccineum]